MLTVLFSIYNIDTYIYDIVLVTQKQVKYCSLELNKESRLVLKEVFCCKICMDWKLTAVFFQFVERIKNDGMRN